MNGIRNFIAPFSGFGVGGLDGPAATDGVATPVPAVDGLEPLLEPGEVSPADQLAARQRAAAQGGDVQQRLLGAMGDGGFVDPTALLGAIMDPSDPAQQQQLVKALQELGFEDVKRLDSPEGQQAIQATKQYAGFVPTTDMDLDLWLSILMAKAEKDRQASAARSSRASAAGRSAPRRGIAPSSGGGAGGSASSGGNGPAQGGQVQLDKTKPVDVANWKAGKGDVTPQQLVDISKKSGHSLTMERAQQVAPQLNRAMAEAKIDTPKKKAAFVAQLMHESHSFKYNEEIASGAAYEGRKDLGNTQPGDGQRFKGRGFIQLTGRANYAAASKALGTDFVKNPELAAKDENAARVAAWYWNSRGLNDLAEAGRFDDVTKRINGGFNGKADRDRLYGNALNELKDSHGLPSTGETEAPGVAKAASPSATDGMNESQKYDYYANLIKQQGGKVNESPGHRSLVGVRQENHKQNSYDDRMAMVWKDESGKKHVREFAGNMESISRYQGRYGNDVNGDGRLDLATLSAGTHEFAKDYSSRYGNILRPTSSTAVMRDTNGDGKGDTLDRTGAGRSILFHKGGYNDTGSAGCQTMRPDDFDRFWNALGGQNKFSYTVVDAGRSNAVS